MSFSSEQKAEIISQPIKNACCKRAMLQGVLAAKAGLSDTNIDISVDSADTAEYIRELIREVYSKDATVATSKKGGRRRIVSFFAPSAARYIEQFISGELFFTEKCQGCSSAFLRGIFLVSGRISDPDKQYSLEFLIPHSRERIVAFFEQMGLSPKISHKPNEILIYFRSTVYIEDFFALAAMNNTAFAVMNAKINGELRNNVNRIINCTTSNIGRAVSASLQQIELIEQLVEKGLISQLPDELQQTAMLRLEHRDLSLSQLAALTTPSISKPGLSHRLKRITELAKELLGITED
nr:DNA-binding protein WhiA [Clostridia bacterium]